MEEKPRGEAMRGSSQARGKERRRLGLLVAGGVVLLAAIAVAAFFWPVGSGNTSKAYALSPESALPEKLRKAPPNVRDAYRFAIANRDVLRQIPCYCGCGAEHQSNAECYIKQVKADGTIEFDLMSYG